MSELIRRENVLESIAGVIDISWGRAFEKSVNGVPTVSAIEIPQGATNDDVYEILGDIRAKIMAEARTHGEKEEDYKAYWNAPYKGDKG